ncbi:MAG TPA: hypothetical protein VNH40_03355 [Gaiellaceae bacterium]|nr:hypothetical protein [Gaiellaceae bacterium]
MRRLRHDTSGRVLAGLIVTVGLLVPLAVFGAPALARTGASASQYEYSSSAQYQYGRVTICHFTHSKKHPWRTIRVAWQGWIHGHSKHGYDHLNACDGSEQLPFSFKHHGHGKKGHGNDVSSNAKSSHGQGHENGQGNKSHGHQGNDD